MAALSQEGRIEPFLMELQQDEELDDQTKGTVTELARDAGLPARGCGLPPRHAPAPLTRTGNGTGSGTCVELGKPLCFPRPFTVRVSFAHAAIAYAMGDRGFEPRTSALSERRSNQLS